MPHYRRIHVAGAQYFFTVTLQDRQSDLLVREVTLLRECVRRTKDRLPFDIDAWVVLPDHMHCVWTLPPGDADYALRWQLIKHGFSSRLPKNESISSSRQRRRERGIWQRRYWEHLIRDERDYARHIDYIHYNPIKHGHVTRLADWPYSSFNRAVAAGMYPPDWGEAPSEQGTQFGE